MPPAKKQQAVNAIDMLQGILNKQQYVFDDSQDNVYREVPVDITTFVSGKEWLGIAPQINPDTGERAESPLSGPQLDFIEKATDLENGITDFVLWVG